MTSPYRSLFVVGVLFAGIGITGCAADSDDDSEPATEESAEAPKVAAPVVAPQKKGGPNSDLIAPKK